MGSQTLVALAHRHGVAEVRRNRHDAMLTSDVRHKAGTVLQGHRPVVIGLRDEVTLSGGLLPPGAVDAVVFDRAGRTHDATCGGGAWLVLLDQPIDGERPVVRFVDAAKAVVPVPVPPGVRLEAVTDAVDPCPACGALAWQKVTAAPQDLYGSDGPGRPTAALCGRCGFEEDLGVLYAATESPSPSWPADENVDDSRAEIAEREAEAHRARNDDARKAPFPLHGLATGFPMVTGLGHSDGEINSVTLAYDTRSGPITVQSDSDPWLESPPWLVRAALGNMAFEGDWPQLSDTAVLLWINARSRERVAEASRAPVREVTLTLDDEPVTFATAAIGNCFAAATRLPGTTILVSGHGRSDGLALRVISPDDLEPSG